MLFFRPGQWGSVGVFAGPDTHPRSSAGSGSVAAVAHGAHSSESLSRREDRFSTRAGVSWWTDWGELPQKWCDLWGDLNGKSDSHHLSKYNYLSLYTVGVWGACRRGWCGWGFRHFTTECLWRRDFCSDMVRTGFTVKLRCEMLSKHWHLLWPYGDHVTPSKHPIHFIYVAFIYEQVFLCVVQDFNKIKSVIIMVIQGLISWTTGHGLFLKTFPLFSIFKPQPFQNWRSFLEKRWNFCKNKPSPVVHTNKPWKNVI